MWDIHAKSTCQQSRPGVLAQILLSRFLVGNEFGIREPPEPIVLGKSGFDAAF